MTETPWFGLSSQRHGPNCRTSPTQNRLSNSQGPEGSPQPSPRGRLAHPSLPLQRNAAKESDIAGIIWSGARSDTLRREKTMRNIPQMYQNRFGEDISFRIQMYKVLCEDFFQKYVPEDSTVLDVAAGYCEFINSIRARKKFATDLNPDSARHASTEVTHFLAPSTRMPKVKSKSIDVAFMSNFLEHIPKNDIQKTFREIHRVLKNGGRLMILQPNIRFCAKDYWMFFDHITPLDDRSVCEALETNGFSILECRPRFLPYTTKSHLPKSIHLLRIYLRFPFFHRFFGQQAFIVAEKSS